MISGAHSEFSHLIDWAPQEIRILDYGIETARKEAALSILFSMQPHLYSPETAAIMNEVGSKKTRDLLGCQFESPSQTPLDCTQTQSVNKK